MMHDTGTTSAPTDAMALSVEGPQPVWKILNEARERAFTGQIVFHLDPEVDAYLDHGIVYYAERRTDAPLGRRLLDAGVLDAAQLERGTVRVGDVEHLGRLFDRDPSVERDAVVVVAESFTEELITELANGVVTTVRATAYRHHASGVHRWFVAPFDAAAQPRPVSAISQIDTFAIDELPALPFSDLDDELTIEWDEPLLRPDDSDDDVRDRLDAFDHDTLHSTIPSDEMDDRGYPTDVFELSLELAEYVDDVNVEQVIELTAENDLVVEDDPEMVVEEDVASPADVAGWIIEDAAPVSDDVDWSQTDDTGSDDGRIDDRFEVVWPDAEDELRAGAHDDTDDDHHDIDDDAEVEFEMPPLILDESVVEDDLLGDEADSIDVSDDVADAVRRAIAAIESASVAAAAPSEVDSTDEWHSFDIVGERVVAATTTDALPVIEPEMSIAPVASVVTGFAPPTMDMRAEVLYQQSSDHETDLRDVDTVARTATGSDRTSALRRLIGGLRRAER